MVEGFNQHMSGKLSLTIVPDKYRAVYANQFMQYISEAKWDKIECAIWPEMVLRDNQSRISSTQPIVFIGIGDEAENNIAQMRVVDEKNGMRIYRNGNMVY